MRVCNLVTNERARFFGLQLDALDRHDVGHETVAVPGSGGADRRSALAYGRFAIRALRTARGDFDILHANYGLTAPPAVIQYRLPVVLSLWGTDLFGRYGQLSRACARRSDAAVVMSEQMSDALDVDCEVIPHGVDLDTFRPRDRDAARADVGWSADTYQVLFPYGPDRPVKNHDRALRVVRAVRERLDAPVALKTLQGLPHERMPVYYAAADALLLTSDHEGSPNVVKEALACNLPVVSTDVGDVRERLDGVTPSAVCRTDEELIDAVVSVLRAGGRSNGREAAREVSVERMGERLIDLYERVVRAG